MSEAIRTGEIQEMAAAASPAALRRLAALLKQLGPQTATAFVSACRAVQPLVPIPGSSGCPTVNIVGTGGGRSTFNITTAAAFVVAAAGARVVKTAGPAHTSRSGSFETCARLGVIKPLSWSDVEKVAHGTGVVFVPPRLMSPLLRQLTASVPLDQLRAVQVAINAIGPLLSPVAVDHRVYGASTSELAELLAAAAGQLGDVPLTVVWGEEGIDEASPIGTTWLKEVTNAGVIERKLPLDGIRLSPVSWPDLAGMPPTAAARYVERLLCGDAPAASLEIVALNAALALQSVRLATDLAEGFRWSLDLIAKGAAWERLQALRASLDRMSLLSTTKPRRPL